MGTQSSFIPPIYPLTCISNLARITIDQRSSGRAFLYLNFSSYTGQIPDQTLSKTEYYTFCQLQSVQPYVFDA
jgi:hypothetical protein